ncbi:MAG: hypothetical protein OEY99_05295 [Aigarchaeota archaeon]|nr:hypothetical protein [Aigarchaeota archaeon]
MDEIREALGKIGIPGRDLYDLPSSPKRFPDGCHWRVEISGVERPSTLRAVIEESKKRDVPVHRLISTVMGSTLLSRDELAEFAELAAEAEMEVIITPGPRATWDVGRQVATPEGALSGIRYRGSDQLSYVIADIQRSIEIGFRGFLVVDEGLLWALTQLKKIGTIPKDVKFKVSVFTGHANPAGARVLQDLGADTFNPLADLSLPMFAAIRKAIDIPMDIHVYLFDSFGGFNRFYECPEFARIAAPCYFKIEPGTSVGALYKPWSSPEGLAFLAREKVKYAEIIRELVERHCPEAKLSGRGPKDLAIPVPR